MYAVTLVVSCQSSEKDRADDVTDLGDDDSDAEVLSEGIESTHFNCVVV